MPDTPPIKLNNSLCPMCGAENSVDVRECDNCGEPLTGYLVKHSQQDGLWRDRHLLVARKGVDFPDCCLKTNQSAEGCTYQLSFGIDTGILPSLLRARKLQIKSCWLGAFVFLVIAFVGLIAVPSESFKGVLFFSGIGAMLLFGIIERFASKYVMISHITKTHVWIKGVHPDFLNQLPQWEGD